MTTFLMFLYECEPAGQSPYTARRNRFWYWPLDLVLSYFVLEVSDYIRYSILWNQWSLLLSTFSHKFQSLITETTIYCRFWLFFNLFNKHGSCRTAVNKIPTEIQTAYLSAPKYYKIRQPIRIDTDKSIYLCFCRLKNSICALLFMLWSFGLM